MEGYFFWTLWTATTIVAAKRNKIRIRYRLCVWFALFLFQSVTYLIIVGLVISFFCFFFFRRCKWLHQKSLANNQRQWENRNEGNESNSPVIKHLKFHALFDILYNFPFHAIETRECVFSTNFVLGIWYSEISHSIRCLSEANCGRLLLV